jgi:hypothetical protein
VELETRKYLVLPDALSLWKAEVEGERLRASLGEARAVRLDGQEFLRFRGVRDAKTAADFANEYGLLAIYASVANNPSGSPAWWDSLTLDPDGYKMQWAVEPLADWVRQAGLLDLACGLLGILKAENRKAATLRTQLISRVRKMPAFESGSTLDQNFEQQIGLAKAAPWPIASVLEGAARAGLLLHPDPIQEWGSDEPVQYLVFTAHGWKQPQQFDVPIAPAEHGRRGVATALGRLLEPWTRLVQAVLIPGDGQLTAGITVPNHLLPVLWLQLANAALTEIAPKLCAWERCPGPPERPGVFLWRWSDRASKGSKHGDSIYCHPRCKAAAQQAKRRAK